MAQFNKLGYAIDQILAEAWKLPANANPVQMTNVVTIDSRRQGNLRVLVCSAQSDGVELTNGATLEFQPYVGATDSPDVVLPSTLITEAVQTDVTWALGEVICEIIIPRTLIPSTAKYLAIKVKCSANESGDAIEAYLLAD